jgi:hypothetical protein
MCWVWARENALIIVFLLNSFFVAKMKTRLVYTVYWLSSDLQTQSGENALKLRGGKGGRRPPPPTHLMTEKYPIPCLCLQQPLAKISQQINWIGFKCQYRIQNKLLCSRGWRGGEGIPQETKHKWSVWYTHFPARIPPPHPRCSQNALNKKYVLVKWEEEKKTTICWGGEGGGSPQETVHKLSIWFYIFSCVQPPSPPPKHRHS